MRSQLPVIVERARVKNGRMASTKEWGCNGYFVIPRNGIKLAVIASDGMGWEHVSVSTQNRTPTWDEMNFVKDLFWEDEETVVQFHPAKSKYVCNHPYVLHMWREIGREVQTPPDILVGVKEWGDLSRRNERHRHKKPVNNPAE